MIDFRDILKPDCTRFDIDVRSKKAALEDASELLAERTPGMNARRLLEGLLDRERLGSTGLGEGIAIPHCRSDECRAPMSAFLKAKSPVDFDAMDDEPVDLLFVLTVPQGETRMHLEILGALARVFDEPANAAALRGAGSDGALYDALQRQLDLAQQE